MGPRAALRALLPALALLALLAPATGLACPFCATSTGEQVRAAIFDERFGADLLLVLSPFPVFALLVALLHRAVARATP